jgi:small-conductance mechanosensitive channel
MSIKEQKNRRRADKISLARFVLYRTFIMSTKLQTTKAAGEVRSPGAQVLGVVLAIIGFLFCFAIVFPYIGIFVAAVGAFVAFFGIGLYAYGSKAKKMM